MTQTARRAAEMSEPERSSGAALLDFLKWAGDKGELNASTAGSFAVAVRNVLAIEEDPDNVDIRSIDAERLLERFETLNRTKYSTSSLNTYKGRFRNAVTLFLAWLDGEPDWKGPLKRRASANKPRRDEAKVKKHPETAGSHSTGPTEHPGDTPTTSPAHKGSNLIAYRLPLRPDLIVQLDLPVELTQADANRISAFVKSLAFTPEDSSSSGNQ
jgi:hypothetical protein